MTKQGASKVLQTLIAEGYISDDAPSADGRARPVALTDRGRDAIATAVRIQAEIEQRWAETVGVRRAATTRKALQDIVKSRGGQESPRLRVPG
jgi:DNA-binding MarR family transcriptional regulator